MCVYMYVYMYVCSMYVCSMYVCMYNVCVYICMYVYMYVCMCVCMYNVCVYVYMYVCMYAHIMFYLMQCFHRTGSKLKTVILRDCDKVRKVNFIFIRSLYLDHPSISIHDIYLTL